MGGQSFRVVLCTVVFRQAARDADWHPHFHNGLAIAKRRRADRMEGAMKDAMCTLTGRGSRGREDSDFLGSEGTTAVIRHGDRRPFGRGSVDGLSVELRPVRRKGAQWVKILASQWKHGASTSTCACPGRGDLVCFSLAIAAMTTAGDRDRFDAVEDLTGLAHHCLFSYELPLDFHVIFLMALYYLCPLSRLEPGPLCRPGVRTRCSPGAIQRLSIARV
jgi:hypothetical protein